MKAAVRLGGSSPAPAAAIALLSLIGSGACAAPQACTGNLSCTARRLQPHRAQRRPPPAAPPSAPVDATVAETEGVAEEQLRQLLVGKTFYLRGGYLGEHLQLQRERRHRRCFAARLLHALLLSKSTRCAWANIRSSSKGCATVCTSSVHCRLRIRPAPPIASGITPKKKVEHITIDRELVTKPKKVKVEKPPRQATAAAGNQQAPINSDADELKAEIAAAPAAERPADAASVTTTVSPAHAAQVLKVGSPRFLRPDSMRA